MTAPPGPCGHAIGIDPGVCHLGYAIACDGVIWAAGCSSHEPREDLARMASRHERSIHNAYGTVDPIVYLESMTAVAGRATTAQDLIDVQTVGCLTAAELLPARIDLLPPAEWKGSTPKAIHYRRLIPALSRTERDTVRQALISTPKDHHKEILDAVGILLYGLGRIERTGAPVKGAEEP